MDLNMGRNGCLVLVHPRITTPGLHDFVFIGFLLSILSLGTSLDLYAAKEVIRIPLLAKMRCGGRNERVVIKSALYYLGDVIGVVHRGAWLGASCTQRKVSMVSFGRISPNSFLSSILLLVVVMVILVVIVVAIVKVVVEIMIIVEITIIGIVVVVRIISGVPSIIKLLFVISGFLHRIVLYSPMKASMSFSVFGTMFGHKTANSWNLLT
ncbi:hypothetical protein Tco_0501767 [Tanacetum coccineum]